MKIALLGVYPISIFSKQLNIDKPPGFSPSWNYNLAKGLAAIEGNEIHFITMDPSIKKDKIICSDGVFIHFLSSYPKIRFLSLYQYNKSKIHKELKIINPDVVHGHGTEHEYAYISATSGYPSVITIHNNLEQLVRNVNNMGFFREIKIYISMLFLKTIFRKCKVAITTTEFMKKFYIGRIQNIYVIENSVAAQFFDYKNFQKNYEEPYFIFIGRICQDKGIEILLSALVHTENVRLKIVGSINDKKYFSDLLSFMSNNDLTERVEYCGIKNQNEIMSLISGSVALILPSLHEPFGLVLAEAMALGVQVIASNVGGIPYVVKHNETGLLFEKNNPKELTSKMVELINSPELRDKLAKNGKLDAAKRFHPSKIANEHMRVYKKVVDLQ